MDGRRDSRESVGTSQSQEVCCSNTEGTSFFMTLLVLPESAMLIVFAAMMTYFSLRYSR